MVNILDTAWYNTKLICMVITEVKIQNIVKTVKTGCVCFVECSVHAPC